MICSQKKRPKTRTTSISGDDLNAYISNPLNAFGVMKRTGFDFFVELRPEIEKNSGTSETFSELKNLTEIFPDIKDYADASSSIALLQVSGYL